MPKQSAIADYYAMYIRERERVAELEAALRKIADLTSGPGLPAQMADQDELFKVAARLNREGYEAYRITQAALKGDEAK